MKEESSIVKLIGLEVDEVSKSKHAARPGGKQDLVIPGENLSIKQ